MRRACRTKCTEKGAASPSRAAKGCGPSISGSSHQGRLRRFGGDPAQTKSRRRQRVVAAMTVVSACRAFLLDVDHFAISRDLAVVTGHAPACERREAEEMNETHHVNDPLRESAIPVPSRTMSRRRRPFDDCCVNARIPARFGESPNLGRNRMSGRFRISGWSRPDFLDFVESRRTDRWIDLTRKCSVADAVRRFQNASTIAGRGCTGIVQ